MKLEGVNLATFALVPPLSIAAIFSMSVSLETPPNNSSRVEISFLKLMLETLIKDPSVGGNGALLYASIKYRQKYTTVKMRYS